MSASEHDLDLPEALDAGVHLRVVAQFRNLSPRELRVRALQLLSLAAQLEHIADDGSEDNGVIIAARRLRDGARLLDDRATRAAQRPTPFPLIWKGHGLGGTLSTYGNMTALRGSRGPQW
jgi:hypothetical protein